MSDLKLYLKEFTFQHFQLELRTHARVSSQGTYNRACQPATNTAHHYPPHDKDVGVVRDKLTNEWAAVVLLEKNLPSPRSPSFTPPSAVIKTLAGLMSLKPITLASKTSLAS